MFEFLFVTMILLHGEVVGQTTIQTKELWQCVAFQNAMIDESLRIPAESPIQTYVGECTKAANAKL